ncbi:MAG: TonB-dependent receptor [Gemmatimonadota bacterium]
MKLRNWSSMPATGALVLLAFGSPASAAAQATIQGTITDSARSRAIAGAQVSVVGTGARTQSMPDGRYRLTGVAPGSRTIRVQAIGFSPVTRDVTVPATGEITVDFVLSNRTVQLEEVVVVGYGTQTRENLSTAVSSVSAPDIETLAHASVDVALQGKAPGVQVTQNAGNPGNAVTIRVRGAASLTANSQPLYVVDGVPMVSEDISQLDLGGQGVRGITGLSPDEIESIDVLKDAAAAAIYGSRGSNGVILITTKQGRSGKPVVTFSTYAGVQSASKQLSLLNATQYLAFFDEAAENDGYGARYMEDQLGFTDAVNTDWQKAIFRRAPIGNAELAVSGGTESIRYRVSGNYFGQEGTVIGSDYRRLGGRVNLDFKASNKLTFSSKLAVSGEANHRVEGDNSLTGVVGNAIANQPMIPIRLSDGSFASTADGLQYANSVAIADLNDTRARNGTILGSLEARWLATPNLTATGRVGVDLYTVRETQYESPGIIGTYAASVNGVAKRAYSLGNKYVFDGFLNWGRAWGGRHNLQVTGGSSVELNRTESNFVRGETLSDPSLHEVSNATTVTDFAGTRAENNLVSVFGRANYGLADKYLFGFAIRTDGSSSFGPDNRYGVFPGGSVAWVMSREPFFAGLKGVDLFKLRASAGLTGNQAIGNYPYQSSACTANYGTEAGYASCTLGNPSLHWERTRQIDVGFDLELFQSRVTLSADWYNKRTNDLLVSRPIAGASGYISYNANVGNIVNKGIEFAITTSNFRSNHGFNWTTSLNMAFNRNRVTKLFDDQPFSAGFRLANRVEVGQPLGAFQMYRFLGVDPATGDAIYDDINKDGEITGADRTIVGSPWPDFNGGLTSTMAWKGLDLTAFFNFSKGNKIFNGMRLFSAANGYYYDNQFSDVLGRWQKPGDVTDVPRASFDGTSGAREVSSRFIEDGSYFRLQELTLGYQLPGSLARSLGFANARVFFRGHNLFTVTNYSGYSPEVNSNGSTANISLGTDFYAYPLARIVSFGFQVGW